MREVCNCGAKFEYDRRGVAMSDDRLERVYEMLKDWRTTHIHEVQPQPEHGEMPMVVESSARVEMAVPFGFTREMEGDVS